MAVLMRPSISQSNIVSALYWSNAESIFNPSVFLLYAGTTKQTEDRNPKTNRATNKWLIIERSRPPSEVYNCGAKPKSYKFPDGWR